MGTCISHGTCILSVGHEILLVPGIYLLLEVFDQTNNKLISPCVIRNCFLVSLSHITGRLRAKFISSEYSS